MNPCEAIRPEEEYLASEIKELFQFKAQPGWHYKVRFPAPGKFLEWDFELLRCHFDRVLEVFTFELKIDRKEPTSGNLFLEVWNCKQNRPSGLTATMADWWAIKSVRRPLCLFRPKAVLEWLQKEGPKHRIYLKKHCGDDNSNGYAVPFVLFAGVIPSAQLRQIRFC